MFDFVLHKTQNITILSKHIASGGRSFAQSRLFRFTTGQLFPSLCSHKPYVDVFLPSKLLVDTDSDSDVCDLFLIFLIT